MWLVLIMAVRIIVIMAVRVLLISMAMTVSSRPIVCIYELISQWLSAKKEFDL